MSATAAIALAAGAWGLVLGLAFAAGRENLGVSGVIVGTGVAASLTTLVTAMKVAHDLRRRLLHEMDQRMRADIH